MTPKRFARIGAGKVELQRARMSPEHEPIEIEPTTDDVEVVGIVVGMIVGMRHATK